MKLLLMVLSFGLLLGCSDSGGDANCDSQMKKYRNDWGTPEEVNKYDSDGYHNWDYWYWSDGRQVSFTWGTDVQGCEVSTYTFSPIGLLKTTVRDSIKSMKDDLSVVVSRSAPENCSLCP